ncbi:MAG: GIY-YIG nuclease family protein [Candidatus Bipolaricaulota bacterium]|nr:MAG: GIY-YIG nuclease family protein [Candidatus Bipolaricaulota bacterium]
MHITVDARRRRNPSVAFEPRDFPEHPGCYLLCGAGDELLYVGKAKNLRRRLSSYFRRSDRPHRKAEMIERVRGIELFLCRNEREALVLERNLIRHYRPPYNGKLSREGEGYYYIARTDEPFPRFVPYRRERVNYALENVRGRYAKLFGPFIGWNLRNRLLDVLRMRFPLRTCHELPTTSCARAQTRGCHAPCVGGIDSVAYRALVNEAARLLRRPSRELLRRMRLEMMESAAQQEYDRARDLRDRIRALEHAARPQAVEVDRAENVDVLWLEGETVTHLLVREGKAIELRSCTASDLLDRHARSPARIVGNGEARARFAGHLDIRVPRAARSRSGELLEICRINHLHRTRGPAALLEEAG